MPERATAVAGKGRVYMSNKAVFIPSRMFWTISRYKDESAMARERVICLFRAAHRSQMLGLLPALPLEMWLSILGHIKMDEFVPGLSLFWFRAATKRLHRTGGFEGPVMYDEVYPCNTITAMCDKWLVVELVVCTAASVTQDQKEQHTKVTVVVTDENVLILMA